MGLFKSGSFKFGRKKDTSHQKPAPVPDAASPAPPEKESSDDCEEEGARESETDPLNLRPTSARPKTKFSPDSTGRSALGASARPSSAHAKKPESETSPGSGGALSARNTSRRPEECWRNIELATEAVNFLATIASQTRGLFETVASPQDVELLAGLLLQGPVPPSAAVSGAVNPHAAASLLVYHLRDRVDGLLSKQAFARWLTIPSLEVSAQEKECQALVKALPRESSSLVAPLFALLRSVAEEHAVYYKDGLNTRIMALSQLFGPLLLRPTKETEHPMACRTIQILVGNPMLVFIPASFHAPPAAAVPKIDMPGNKKLSAPPKTVSFRGDTPSIAEIMDQKKSKKNQEGKGRQSEKSDEGYDSEGTNYNIGPKAHDPNHDSFLEMVACAPQEQVARELEGAMRGGPLLKYSSRGKPVAVMFFKLSQDASSLNWAPVTNPSDLKYGLLLDHVEEVRIGRSAVGQFQGGTHEAREELRLMLRIGGGNQLEVEALSQPHLTMWSITIQRIVVSRSQGFIAPVQAAMTTHRNWGAADVRQRGAPVPGLSLNKHVLSGGHGSATARLLNNTAMAGPGPQGGSMTSRYGNNQGMNGMSTARPSTARPVMGNGMQPWRPEHMSEEDARNVELLLSKARHKRLKDVHNLLDGGVPVDSQDAQGNTMLIVACQNGHKKVAKEALRRNCDINHQNKRGHTCLHFSFAYKYDELGHYLITKGADPGIQNMYGRTCFQGLADFRRMEPQTPSIKELEDSNGRDKERTSARCRGEANSPESRTSADSFAQELEALRQKNAILEIENSKLKERSVEAPAYMKSVRSSPMLDDDDRDESEVPDEDRRFYLLDRGRGIGESQYNSSDESTNLPEADSQPPSKPVPAPPVAAVLPPRKREPPFPPPPIATQIGESVDAAASAPIATVDTCRTAQLEALARETIESQGACLQEHTGPVTAIRVTHHEDSPSKARAVRPDDILVLENDDEAHPPIVSVGSSTAAMISSDEGTDVEDTKDKLDKLRAEKAKSPAKSPGGKTKHLQTDDGGSKDRDKPKLASLQVDVNASREDDGDGGKVSQGSGASKANSLYIPDSAGSSIKYASSSPEGRSSLMGWLGANGEGVAERTRPSERAGQIKRAIAHGMRSGSSTKSPTEATGDSFTNLAEVSEISADASDREGAPDTSMPDMGSGDAPRRSISPSIVESDSTVQLGGFERKSTYNASRAKFLGHRDGGGATDGGGHRSADVSGEEFGTLSVSASQSIMVQADSAHVDMTCSVSNISTVSTTAGGQVGDSLDTSHNRHAKEMQGVLDQVRHDMQEMEDVMAAVITPFAVDTDVETDVEMVRRESAHQNPNSKDWKNQLFRPHTDKVPELETPVAGRAFVGGKRDDGKHAGWKKGHRDQDMQEAKRKELSDDDSLGVSTDSLSDALKEAVEAFDSDDSDSTPAVGTHSSRKKGSKNMSPYVTKNEDKLVARQNSGKFLEGIEEPAKRSSSFKGPRTEFASRDKTEKSSSCGAGADANAKQKTSASASPRPQTAGGTPRATQRTGTAAIGSIPGGGQRESLRPASAGGTPREIPRNATAALGAMPALPPKKTTPRVKKGGWTSMDGQSQTPKASFQKSRADESPNHHSPNRADTPDFESTPTTPPRNAQGSMFAPVPSPEFKSPAERDRMRVRAGTGANSSLSLAFSPAGRRR